jgi:hypothetical protein
LVVISDCDGVWLGDGLAYAQRAHAAADVLVAGAHLAPGAAANDSGLEPPSGRLVGALDTGEGAGAWLRVGGLFGGGRRHTASCFSVPAQLPDHENGA